MIWQLKKDRTRKRKEKCVLPKMVKCLISINKNFRPEREMMRKIRRFTPLRTLSRRVISRKKSLNKKY